MTGRQGSSVDAPAPVERGGSSRGALPGVVVAGITALVSGLSIFVNSYGVHAIGSPAVYTTAKNLVATLFLGGCALGAYQVRRHRPASAAGRFVTAPTAGGAVTSPAGPVLRVFRWICLLYVGVVGGGLAFVLFFEGLVETSAAPAAFWRDTLVIWVAVLAVPFLGERIRWWNVAAVGLLVVGQVALIGGIGHPAASHGELLVLSATLLWAIEVVLAKILLRSAAPAALSLVRMGVGTVTLVVYLAASGSLRTLLSLGADQVAWALLTGLLLAVYVGTWMTALSRARALDVTSVLVASALVTALLQAMAGSTSLAPHAVGLALIAVGTGVVLGMGLRERWVAEHEGGVR